MNSHSTCLPKLAAVLGWLVAAPMPLAAAAGELNGIVEQANVAMQAEKWEAANKLLGEALGKLGADPLASHGARAGELHYRKGICEMKLGEHRKAMGSFESCYRDFPNNTVAGPGNTFHKKALLRWGEAAQAGGQYQEAIELYRKFIAERDKQADDYQEGVFFINLAICHLKLGRIPEGIENLEIAINNKVSFKTPASGVMAAYQALVEAAIAANNEQAILDFVGRNRAPLAQRPRAMLGFAPVVLKLAVDAFAADMPRAAMEMYGMIPDTRVAIADLKAHLAEVEAHAGGRPSARVAKLKEQLAKLEGAVEAGQCIDGYVLEGQAAIYERLRLGQVAQAAYREIGQRFPGGSKREEALYQLVDGGAIASWAAEDDAGGDELVDFSEGMSLMAGRKYAEALAKFESCVQVAGDGLDAAVARLRAMECQRRLGDLDGLGKLYEGFEKDRLVRASERLQVDLYQLWDGVARHRWEEVEGKAQRWLARGDLAGTQRAQAGYCLGVATERLGKLDEAWLAYAVGLVAGGGQDETLVRESVLGMLRACAHDPQVREAMDRYGSPAEQPDSLGHQRLVEAARLAAAFPRYFGAGKPLPAEFEGFLKYAGDEEAAVK